MIEVVRTNSLESVPQLHSLNGVEDVNPMLVEKEVEAKGGRGALLTALRRPRRNACRLSKTTWLAIVSTTVLVVSLLLTPLGCIVADKFGNFRRFLWINTIFKFTRQNYPPLTVTCNSSIAITNQTLRIVLLGDSVITRPFKFHNLKKKIQAEFSRFDGYTFDIINCGFDGSKVSNMRLAPLNSCAIPANPHAVILLWDADVANIAERLYSREENRQIRRTYVANVEFVISTLKKKGIFVAIAGYGILGEGAKVFAPRSERFNNKEKMLKTYNSMNENIATSFSIPFIDIRRTLSQKIPFFQLCYKNCVTYDGEHSNERGALVIAKMFAEVLSKWLTSS